jgi:hypothetical protein
MLQVFGWIISSIFFINVFGRKKIFQFGTFLIGIALILFGTSCLKLKN